MAADDTTSTDSNEPDDQKGLSRWIETIERYERGAERWKQRCEKIIKIYLDAHRSPETNSPRRFALLWSNIETLKPAVYAKQPIAVVSRRFKDPDPPGRKASEVLERCINTSFDLYGVDSVMQLVQRRQTSDRKRRRLGSLRRGCRRREHQI